MVGVRVAFAQFDHRALQGGSLATPVLEAPVETSHKIRRALVVNVPQTQE